jgi:hypothetical protein
MADMQTTDINNLGIYVFSGYRGYLNMHQVIYTTEHLAMINEELTVYSSQLSALLIWQFKKSQKDSSRYLSSIVK